MHKNKMSFDGFKAFVFASKSCRFEYWYHWVSKFFLEIILCLFMRIFKINFGMVVRGQKESDELIHPSPGKKLIVCGKSDKKFQMVLWMIMCCSILNDFCSGLK